MRAKMEVGRRSLRLRSVVEVMVVGWKILFQLLPFELEEEEAEAELASARAMAL